MPRRPAGEYIHPIIVRQQIEVPNASGQLVKTASEVCRRLARKEVPNGKEITLPEGHQQMGINSVILCVMYDPRTAAINPKMQVLYNGETYEIVTSRDVTGRREEIQIDCIQTTT